MPPDLYDDWEGVVRDKGTVFDVTGKISVYSSQAGKLVQLQGNELRDDDKVFEAVVPVEEEEVEERKDHPEEHEKKEDNKQGQENIGQTARLIAVELEERLSALKEQGANDHETLDVNKQKSDEIVHNAAAQALQGNMTEADLAESQKEIDKIPMSKTRRALIGAIFGVLASVIAIIATHGVAIVPLLAGGKTIGSSAAGGAFVGAVTGLFNRGSGKKTGAEGGNANDTPKEPPQSPSKR
jgi:hypothetical protein